MKLKELEQVKKDLADGVIVSRDTWKKVLEAAIDYRIRLDVIAEEFDTIVTVYAFDEHGNEPYVDFNLVRMNLP